VRLNWKSLRLAIFPALLMALTGCSGINASKSVSPLDFLIPGGGGLMRGLLYVPPPAVPVDLRETPPSLPTADDVPVLPFEPTQLVAQVQ
jgi:hypothetical protein